MNQINKHSIHQKPTLKILMIGARFLVKVFLQTKKSAHLLKPIFRFTQIIHIVTFFFLMGNAAPMNGLVMLLGLPRCTV